MGLAWIPEIQDQPWFTRRTWLARHDATVANARSSGGRVLFFGDSITESWNEAPGTWQREFAGLGAANAGISGDETQHVLWRVLNGGFHVFQPRLAVLLVGTNNLGNSGHSAGDTARGIEAVVASLQSSLPTARILLHAVLPREARPDTELRRAAADVNRRIAGLADSRRVFWLDASNLFLAPDGTLLPKLMPDALHLSPEAYNLWAGTLAPLVREALAGAPPMLAQFAE
jgi:lysophospholipase L1-like esterase